MTSGTHALILAQSAFEAVCKERDEIKTQADNLAKELEASKAYAERCKQGCIKLSFAIDRIDYACGEPNEMEVSDYCIHQNEEHVVKRAKEKIEACRKERDEALAKLSTVHLWIEKNLSGGFINSLTYLQNLECVADDWYEKLVATIRQRDKAQEGAINYFARIGELEKERDEARERAESKHGLWMDELARVTELEKQLDAMREAIEAAHEALENADGSSYHIRGDACLTREASEQRAAALAKLQPFIKP